MTSAYYEFNEQEYYGLLAIREAGGNEHVRAAEVYVAEIGGDTVTEVLAEGEPVRLSAEEAFERFFRSAEQEGISEANARKEFEEIAEGVLLIDGSLI